VHSGGEFFGSETKLFGKAHDEFKTTMKGIFDRKNHLHLRSIDAKSRKTLL
jgi:hypothetical protein